jgi:hypothetical protein
MPRSSKAPHPADIANAAIIARAVRFDIALFLGVGRYAHAAAATLSEARREAERLAREIANGRHALIYAIDANGRSALVTGDISTEGKGCSMKTYAKRFNAQRAAKAAGHDLEDVEIVKTKDGFAWRLSAEAEARKAKPANNTDANKGANKNAKSIGKRAAIEDAARKGELPDPPDFSAPTHARFRNKLARLVELATAGDISGLKSAEINPVSSSPKAMARYRDLCVIALEARRAS